MCGSSKNGQQDAKIDSAKSIEYKSKEVILTLYNTLVGPYLENPLSIAPFLDTNLKMTYPK